MGDQGVPVPLRVFPLSLSSLERLLERCFPVAKQETCWVPSFTNDATGCLCERHCRQPRRNKPRQNRQSLRCCSQFTPGCIHGSFYWKKHPRLSREHWVFLALQHYRPCAQRDKGTTAFQASENGNLMETQGI